MTDTLSQPERLVAIGLQKSGVSPALQHLEETLVFGVLTELSLLAPLTCKDMATTADRIILNPDLPMDQVYQKYAQICQSSRSRYLLTGSLAAKSTPTGEQSVHVQLQVYDSAARRFAVEASETLSGFVSHDGKTFPEIQAFNQLLDRTVSHLLKDLNPSQPTVPVRPLSNSYEALLLVVEAPRQETPAEKISLYQKALQLDPALEPAYAQLAKIYRTEEQYEQSVVYYRKALENSHAVPSVKAQYATDAGICLAVLGKHDLALQWWNRAIEYKPDFINPYFNIANVHEDRGEFEAAESYFCKAQQLAPDDFRTYFNLARIYAKLGVWDKALTQYQFQLKTDENDPWIHSDIANVYLHLGELMQARQHLEKTVQLDAEGEAGQFARLILDGMGAA